MLVNLILWSTSLTIKLISLISSNYMISLAEYFLTDMKPESLHIYLASYIWHITYSIKNTVSAAPTGNVRRCFLRSITIIIINQDKQAAKNGEAIRKNASIICCIQSWSFRRSHAQPVVTSPIHDAIYIPNIIRATCRCSSIMSNRGSSWRAVKAISMRTAFQMDPLWLMPDQWSPCAYTSEQMKIIRDTRGSLKSRSGNLARPRRVEFFDNNTSDIQHVANANRSPQWLCLYTAMAILFLIVGGGSGGCSSASLHADVCGRAVSVLQDSRK